jgi:hypothetical protein
MAPTVLTELPSAGVCHGYHVNVDTETQQVLDLALEMTRTALGLADERNHR